MSDALAAFEALVLSQQPASVPWQPVTDYSFEARKAIEGKHPELIVEVFQPTQVMDAGMGLGHLVHLLRERMGVSAAPITTASSWVMGFDPQRTGLCYGDLALDRIGHEWLFKWKPDLVICREVLEHLTIRQIRQAVTNLCALSSRYVYVTTRFHQAPAHLLDVQTADDLDPTHQTMLNQDFLRVLFVLEGFKRRADLEQRMDWKNLGRVLVYERAA